MNLNMLSCSFHLNCKRTSAVYPMNIFHAGGDVGISCVSLYRWIGAPKTFTKLFLPILRTGIVENRLNSRIAYIKYNVKY